MNDIICFVWIGLMLGLILIGLPVAIYIEDKKFDKKFDKELDRIRRRHVQNQIAEYEIHKLDREYEKQRRNEI